MQGEVYFPIHQNLNTEKASTDIKSFFTRGNGEEKFNKKITEKGRGKKEPECNKSCCSKVVSRIKQLAVFTLRKGDVDGISLLKRVEINFSQNNYV